MQKVSVVMPVYNSGSFLEPCIKSVLNQTYGNLEFIIIDDGSTDGSEAICDRYAKIDRRIKVVHQTNSGVSVARNRGMGLATGEFISFIDSDDQLEEDMYSFLIQLMNDYDVDISHCGYKRMDEKLNIIKEVSGTHEIIEQKNIEAIECMLNGKYFVGGLWNKLFKTQLVKDLRFAEELRNNEDILFNVMAFAKAKNIVFADETKYCYLEHTTSACNRMSLRTQLYDSIVASEKMLEVKNPRLEGIIWNRLFNCRMNLYRFLLMNSDTIGANEILEQKQPSIKNYKKLKNPGLRETANYFMLIKFPVTYKLIYKIYNTLRKPNWDVKVNNK